MKNNGPKLRRSRHSGFERLSSKITKATGSPYASLSAAVLVILWASTGPVFKYSETWQLIINTTTTIITFLMVFVIQQSQNKDTVALQLKLNELIAASEKSSNRLIDVEDLSSEELEVVKKFYVKLAKLAKTEDIHKTHSFDEAEAASKAKKGKSTK